MSTSQNGPALGGKTLNRSLIAVGISLILVCVIWWVPSFKQQKLVGADFTAIPSVGFLGTDFSYNYYAVKLWLEGGKPYSEMYGWPGQAYSYPPIVLPMFLWTHLFSLQVNTVIWMFVVASGVAFASWVGSRWREQFGFGSLPAVFIAGAMLVSLPVVFAMERGNCDVIPLVLIAGAALAMRRKTKVGDGIAGALLATAAWVKIYPGIAILALIAMRKDRVWISAAVAGILIGVIPWKYTVEWIEAAPEAEAGRVGFIKQIPFWWEGNSPARQKWNQVLEPASHSLCAGWNGLWWEVGMGEIASFPGILGAPLLLLPLAYVVTRGVGRDGVDRVMYPYLLWMTALGTYMMPISFDYNLIFLPLAALVVWNWRRDDYWAQAGLILMFLTWAQPFGKGVSNLLGLTIPVGYLLKLLALVAVGRCLASRAREGTDMEDVENKAPLSAQPQM